MTHLKKREFAETLRKEGYSYSLIAKKTGISKGTLSAWFSGMPYTPNAIVRDRVSRATTAMTNARIRVKKQSIQKACNVAKEEVGRLSKRDLFMLGIGLYIGEGAKTANVEIINSDPKVILLAKRWFMEICNVPLENFVLNIHTYPDNNLEECLSFWSRITDIPRTQFGKPQIDTRKNKRMAKRGKLVYGTAHLRVKSLGDKNLGVFLQRKILAWMDLVLAEE